MKLSLFNLHNYRDRVIISKPLISDYTALLGSPITLGNINFIANDGIRTEQIVNYPQTMPLYCDGTAAPSYVIVSEDYNSNYIVSRWWVIGSQILRNGQARLSLLRDVLADYDDVIKKKTMFIKKGWVNSVNDPAALNSEDMTFNQIKKQELPIKDKSGAAWYVGYLSKDFTSKEFAIPPADAGVMGTYSSEESYTYSKYNASKPFLSENFNDFIVNYYFYGRDALWGVGRLYKIGWDKNGNAKTPWTNDGYKEDQATQAVLAYGIGAKDDTKNPRGIPLTSGDFGSASNHMWSRAQTAGNWIASARSLLGSHSTSEIKMLEQENGKIYQFGTAIKKVRLEPITISNTLEVANGDAFAQTILSYAQGYSGFTTTSNVFGNYTSISYTTTGYIVHLDPVNVNTINFTIPANRVHLQKEPFDMFAIPAHTIQFYNTYEETDPELCRKMVAQIIAGLPKGEGGSLLYDIQLVPYCPFDDYIFPEQGSISLAGIPNSDSITNWETVYDVDTQSHGLILFMRNNEFRKTVFTNPITVPTDPLQFKIDAQTKMYRLCSPNYNGQFEFSAEKNNGVQGWNIDFTYKPYMPYIRVAPIFGRLYGQDFGDARGLICGGDFSISQTNDAWEQYQLTNKNYQNIFDRQITNMEVNNAVQREQEKWGISAGTVQGTVSGAIGGGMSFGPWGALAGAVGGGLASGAAGYYDRVLNEKLRSEAMSYARDQFTYNLQQIKALPYSLTKVGSQNVNYKYFPFLEIYEATETEAAALTNKIKWNGMTIMRIGAIPDFIKTTEDDIGTFIQATPLRITTYTAEDKAEDGIEGASLFLDVIAAELEQGVYYK